MRRSFFLCIAMVLCALTVKARGGTLRPIPNEIDYGALLRSDGNIYWFLACVCFFVIGRTLILSLGLPLESKRYWGWSLFVHSMIAFFLCLPTASFRVTGIPAMIGWQLITTIVGMTISMVGGVFVTLCADFGKTPETKTAEPSAA